MKQKMTRLTSVLLAVIMLLSVVIVPTSAQGRFKDVPEGLWYSDAVEYVAERGMMNGIGSNTFDPDGTLNRAMFVTVLARMAKAEVDDSVSVFEDVPTGKWYTGAVAWAKENGLVNGISSKSFAPMQPITRQDMCTIFFRFVEKMGYNLPSGMPRIYSDADQVSRYAREAVALCSRVGLINGYKDNSFRPVSKATRAQVAVVMMRLDQMIAAQNVTVAAMPAQSFDKTTEDNFRVVVEAPEGALPENTEMTVRRVSDEAGLAAIQARVDSQVYAAADITFTKDDVEIEPEKTVMVQISLDGLNELKNPTVVHVKDDGGVEPVYGAETVSLTRSGSQKAIRFYAKDFSVYAVIEQPENPDNYRMSVNFYNPYLSGDNKLVATMYVKNSDDDGALDIHGNSVHNVDLIVYDPGLGRNGDSYFTLSGTDLFVGWTIDDARANQDPKFDTEHYGANFSANTKPYTVAQIREFIKTNYTEPDSITNNSELNIYAMVMKVYTVNYLDENEVSLGTHLVKRVKTGTETTNPKVDYTVNMAYIPGSVDQNFEGWNIDSGAVYNTEGTQINEGPIKNSTTVQIDGNVTFSVNAPSGHWLVYHENGKGATFNAAVFLKKDDKTSVPATNPTRNGYTFGGWYTINDDADLSALEKDSYGNYLIKDEELSSFTAFTPGSTTTKQIDLYARWILADSAEYTVVIWQQKVKSVEGEFDYDFKESVTLTGAPLATINTVSQVGTGNDAYVTVNGAAKKWTGFHLKEFDTGVTIDPTGSTVVNVYYDRNEITINFHNRGYTLTETPDWNSDKVYAAEYNGNKYIVDSNGYFYTVPESIDRSKTYYYYRSSNDTWYEVNYRQANNGTYYWMVHNYSSSYEWTYFNDVTTEDWESGLLKERHDAKNGEYTYTLITGTLDTSKSYWLYYNGNYYELTYRSGSGSNAYWYCGAPIYDYWKADYWRNYYGPIYERSVTTYPIYEFTWADYKQFKGRYGSTLEENGYTWPNEYNWYDTSNASGAVSGTRTTFLDAFIPTSESPVVELYGTDTTTGSTYYFQKQNETKTSYVTANTVNSTKGGSFLLSDKYNGFEPYQWSYDGQTWNDVGDRMYVISTSDGYQVVDATNPDASIYYDADKNSAGFQAIDVSSASTLYIRFNRLSFDIRYSDGRFLDGEGKMIEGETENQQLKLVEDITYGADISDYGKEGNNYYVPTRNGYVFGGWFANKECTPGTELNFHDMPYGGVQAYALWRQIEYRAYLNPHFPDGVSVNWGNSDQKLCFRVAYGASVSAPTGIDNNKHYEMVGWFFDYDGENYENPYNADVFQINDSNTVHYNSGLDPEDTAPLDYTEYDPLTYELENTSNSDAENGRFWITRKIELHALWRAILDGADGINVEYVLDSADAQYITGQAANPDNILYSDQAKALARPSANATYRKTVDGSEVEMRFMHWKIMKWENNAWVDSGEIVYPGGDFTINANYAKVTDKLDENNQVIAGKHIYMMRLVAVYDSNEQENPTHITWFANGGAVKDSKVEGLEAEGWTITGENTIIQSHDTQINMLLDLVEGDVLEREGYTFLGWARVKESDHVITEDGVITGYKPDSTLTYGNVWLQYHPAETTEVETTEPGSTEPIKVTKVKSAYYTLIEEGNPDNGKTVIGVAADEHIPYHTLYAVWANDFYVYHSATGKVEAVAMTNGTVDLTSYVSAGHRYGGYFMDNTKAGVTTLGYGGVKEANLQAAEYKALWADSTSGTSASASRMAVVSEAVIYDASALYDDGADHAVYENVTETNEDGEEVTTRVLKNHVLWNYSLAQTADGTNLVPKGSTVYYLKEVPEAYMPNNLVWTYDYKHGSVVNDIYLLSAIDDPCYTNCGFLIDDVAYQYNALANQFSITVKDWPTYTFKAEQLGETGSLKRGYVAVRELGADFIAANKTFTVQPVWTTRDGVSVAMQKMAYTISADKKTITKADITEKDPYIYINYKNQSDYWIKDSAVIRGCFTGDNGDAWVVFEPVPNVAAGSTVLRAEKPNGTYNSMVLTRGPASVGEAAWGSYWNRTNNILLVEDCNYLLGFDAYGDGPGYQSNDVSCSWGTYTPVLKIDSYQK